MLLLIDNAPGHPRALMEMDNEINAISTTYTATSSTEVLNPSKSSMRVGINFFQTPVNVEILILSHESMNALNGV